MYHNNRKRVRNIYIFQIGPLSIRTYHQVVVPCCDDIGLTTHCVQLVDGGLIWLVDKEGWSLVPYYGDESI